jgi:hypothetical protein
MQKKTIKSNAAIKLAVAGTALAGLAATVYFFFGPKGKKNRQTTKAWAIKMRGDVLEKFETAKEITEPIYLEIIETVANEYKKTKKASQKEIDDLATDLKKHWKSISKLATANKKKPAKSAKKTTK